MLRKRRSLAALAVASLCLLAALPQATRASFPGKPGMIVFNYVSVHPPASPEPVGGLYALSPGDAEPRRLTANPRDYEPSFAPSGRKLVFRRFGPNAEEGLYCLDLRTGRTKKLVSGRGDQDAAFGRRGMVAFTRFVNSSYELFVRTGDGRLRRLTRSTVAREESPVFTPDGKRILFIRSYARAVPLGAIGETRPSQLYSIRADGTGLRRHAVLKSASDLDIAPGGSGLVFGAPGPSKANFGRAIWTKDLREKRSRLLSVNATYPAYSPAGGKIAYTNYEGLWIRRADRRGAPRRILATEYPPSANGGTLAIQPAWQPLPAK